MAPLFSIVYIGTFNQRKGQAEGLFVCRLDRGIGSIELVQSVDAGPNPAFLTVDSARGRVFAVNEVNEFLGVPGGAVTALKIANDGLLTKVNWQYTFSPGPCYVSLSADRRWVLVANYRGGSLDVYPILPDGALAPASAVVLHHGSGVHPRRQEAAHAHSIVSSPDGSLILVPDLGKDQVRLYRWNRQGLLLSSQPPFKAVLPGRGPRHLEFHPNGRFVYLSNELESSVSVFSCDAQAGSLDELQTLSSLPADFQGESSGADLHLHPSGRFLYASNRGHDSLAVYDVHPETGLLSLKGFVATQGQTPRNFAVDPLGEFLLVGNQDSDTVVSFRIDPNSGMLVSTGQSFSLPAPVCLKFL